MLQFIFSSILWTLAIYGTFEIIKTILDVNIYKSLKSEGIHIIVAVKNQENKIEGFLRNFLFRIIYGKEENIKDIIIVDLESTDDTPLILERLNDEYSEIKVTNWKECKDLIEKI